MDRKRRGPRPPTALRPPSSFAPIAAPVMPPGRAEAEPDLSVDLGRGLVLANPILVASGTFGYGVEYASAIKAHDPHAEIFAPMAWGWCGYFGSSGECAGGPDRDA